MATTELPVMDRIARDVRTVRNIALFWLWLTLIGMVLGLLYLIGHLK